MNSEQAEDFLVSILIDEDNKSIKLKKVTRYNKICISLVIISFTVLVITLISSVFIKNKYPDSPFDGLSFIIGIMIAGLCLTIAFFLERKCGKI